MKTTIGGDRLGSGNKQTVSLRNYERSTHDLSQLWRSSMGAGTLVPFLNLVALPGDSFDIDLNCEVLTLPTVGPLFGSFKVQLDVFQVPIRLYNAALHMNKIGIGMDMSSVYLPRLMMLGRPDDTYVFGQPPLADNAQINPSSLYKYLGISGLGKITTDQTLGRRYFNGVPFLGYWDIYKNYYANKQEERGFCIHADTNTINQRQAVIGASMYKYHSYLGDIYEQTAGTGAATGEWSIVIYFDSQASKPNSRDIIMEIGGVETPITSRFAATQWNDDEKTLTCYTGEETIAANENWEIPAQIPLPIETDTDYSPSLVEFDLADIDSMRESILQAPTNAPFIFNESTTLNPYALTRNSIRNGDSELLHLSQEISQELLGIKTYQSDLFNNWISTEWIDGTNGINEVTAVDTTGDSFTIDSLNLAQKVYNMLNRIAISGGSYDDWLDAVYTHERARSVESPVYLGSLIKELAFESVVSNADTEIEGNTQPLGTLAGRGRLTGKNKGGRVKVKIDEPSYIMGIVSLTPRIDYSQGNNWDTSLMTMNDFHKPALDAIGFQELITEQMTWQSTQCDWDGTDVELTRVSAGKQPAWINYMTAVNKTFGHFADERKSMFMTLNRRYETNGSTGEIQDLTTYIDPTKFNQIFADTELDAQNFWVQISSDITARRKMSAKVIPNL